MKFEKFISEIGVAVNDSSLSLQSIVHNADKERYEITLTHEPVQEWEIEDADTLMDYIADNLGIYVDGLNITRIDAYYNITDGDKTYYSVKDECLYQIKQ